MSFPLLRIEELSFAVAPYFSLDGDWSGWLEVACAGGWRAPRAEEIESWNRAGRRGGALASAACLFLLPEKQRVSFWSLLQVDGASGFAGFAEDVVRYLSYKQMAPPEGAVFDLVVCPSGDPADLGERVWAVVNVADPDAFVVRGGVRLRLATGAGCRTVSGMGVRGNQGDEPGLLLVVRHP